MGMDVYGKKPKSEKGKYFRNNLWHWRPLWGYCQHVAPEITAQVKYAQSNDGDGLNAHASKMLAKVLREELAAGRTEQFAKEYQEWQDSLPDKVCWICEGTGKRKKPPEIGPGRLKCNGCDGKGKVRPDETHYPFDVENVKEFADFLQDCGGFEIW